MSVSCNNLLLLLVFTVLAATIPAKSGRRKIDHFTEHGGDIVELRHQTKLNGSSNVLKINDPHRWGRDRRGLVAVPYQITGRFAQDEVHVIKNAMQTIHRFSCVRFIRKGKQHRDFVDIQNKPNQGCYASVGRYNGRNILMLESNDWATCITHDIVIHELFHVLGFWHEHMRFDRDKYIDVIYRNIDPVYFDQFTKVASKETRTYGVAYDYRSIMHYARDVFGKKPGLTTMQTKDRRYQNIIGAVKQPSAGDYRKLCTLYGCKKCIGNQPFRPAPPSTWLNG